MPNITFISTIHKELGKCNAEELYKIIKTIRPDVIFLEAVDDTYSSYDHLLFSNYGVSHRKLEICAIQKYDADTAFKYVPVCDIGLSDAFDKKIAIVCENAEMQKLIDNFNFLASNNGFEFLNSLDSIKLQEGMRMMERRVLNNSSLDETVKADIAAYEDPMIRNIYSYCKDNQFNSAIFMCGAAHRKSIIEKIEKSRNEEHVNVSWTIFGS